MARLYHAPKFMPNHLSISVDGNEESGYNFTVNQTIPRKEKGVFGFGGDIPSRSEAPPRGRLLLKIAARSVKTCGRVRPEIRTHPKEKRLLHFPESRDIMW
jgi:hypothetical protein